MADMFEMKFILCPTDNWILERKLVFVCDLLLGLCYLLLVWNFRASYLTECKIPLFLWSLKPIFTERKITSPALPETARNKTCFRCAVNFSKKRRRRTFSEDWGLSSLKSVFLIDKKCRKEHLADNRWKALQRGLKRFLKTRTNTRCLKNVACVFFN